ncbi:hypothetical protein CR513_17591, partial [Mucuna pruriens]
MFTRRGIKATVINMRSLRSVKEVEQLVGRIMAPSCFLSRSVEKLTPIFQHLRKAECFNGFLGVEGFVSGSSSLTWLVAGKPIYVYIFVFDNIVSSIIIQEGEGEQWSFYYKIEKATLAIIITAKKLRLYFQSHPMMCRTDLSIQQILQKPDLADRMTGWAIELFDNREAPKESKEWALCIDDSSNKKGPSGVLIEQSLCFGFQASNNQAKYESILAGIRLAKELGTTGLTIKSNSQLVTIHVNGKYQARDLQLIQYLGAVKAQVGTLERFTLLHVPSQQNERADLLAKLATT